MIKVVIRGGQFSGWSKWSIFRVVIIQYGQGSIIQDGQGSQHTRMAKVVKAYKDST